MVSSVHVERYSVALNDSFILGEEKRNLRKEMSLKEMLKDGLDRFGPQRVTSNVCGPGLVYLNSVKVKGVEIIYGGLVDAWQWNPNAVGEHVNTLELTPDDVISFDGVYTGRVPILAKWLDTREEHEVMYYKPGELFVFMLSFTGPVHRGAKE